ncbi:MAG: OmpH family outer membrane protein [Planctomycetota bacterium]
MRKIGVCLALIGATISSIGCGTQSGGSSSRGGIAVVDLDKVAAETGKSLEMREALQAQESAYKRELVTFQNMAETELQTRLKDIKEKGDEAPEESKREFMQIRQNASNILAQAQNKAGAQLGQLQQIQVAKFRADLKPIIQEAAAKRGLSVVIPKNEGLLLTVDPGVDITDEVIKAYQAKRLSTPASAPTAAAPAAAPAPAAVPAATAEKSAEKPAEKAPAKAAAKPATKEAKASKAVDSEAK